MKKLQALLEELDRSADKVKRHEVIWVAATARELEERRRLDVLPDDIPDDEEEAQWKMWAICRRQRMEAEINLHHARNRALDLRVIVTAMTDKA